MSGRNESRLKETMTRVEERLKASVPETGLRQEALFRAMRYSLLAGGKRIRPVMLLEFCRLCGGNEETALPFACALEMVHTYSLIHDDLPCMDNDDLRRGRPSCHKVFGEDMALLAGDALLTMAFETMLSPETVAAAGADRAAEAAGILASSAGAYGMAGGQAIDLLSEGKSVPLEALRKMDECKTGALIAAAAQMGCVLAGADRTKTAAAERYARAVGLAFQIVDDILDVTGDTGTLGKPAGSDEENGKSTYVKLMGLERAKQAVRGLTQTAVDALEPFGTDAGFLVSLAKALSSRNK